MVETAGRSTNEKYNRARANNSRYRWMILIGLVVSAILEIMDTSMLNVALPQMAGSLDTTMTDIAWVSTAYLLANVVVLPMTAWLSQRFGRKNYLVASILIFTISRALCATSPSLGFIILWRLIQGAAGAALISTSQAVLLEIFPSEQQGLVQALFFIGLVVAPAVAPLIGGEIVDNYNWQMAFYIHIPVALISLYLVGAHYADTSTPRSRGAAGKLDVAGIAFLAIGLGSLQYVLEEGQRNDWFNDATILNFTILAALGIIALIIWELSPANKFPVVNLRVYGNRSLAAAVVISFAIGIGMYGVQFAFAVFLQGVLGFTSLKSGLALIPMGIGAMLSLMILAVITTKVDVKLQIVTGLAISGIGSWMLGFNTLSTGIENTWFPSILVGFGVSGSILPVTYAAFAALRPSEIADGAAQMGLGRQLGGSLGIALLDTFIVHMTAISRSTMVEHVNGGNPLFTHTWAGVAAYLVPHSYSWAESQRVALGIISGEISLQSALEGYNIGFQGVALVFFFCILLVPLLKAHKQVSEPAKPTR